MKALVTLTLIGILFCEAPLIASAVPVPIGALPVAHTLKAGQVIRRTIIRPAPVGETVKIAAPAVKHLFLPQDTNRVIIVAADYDFKKEHESFEQFRKHYMVYWLIFNVMLVTRILWKT